MRNLLRAPALHFTVIGGLLFAAWPAPQASLNRHGVEREPIVISQARRVQIREAHEREQGAAPTPQQERALIDEAIREEILYREALDHRLDLNDRSIQWRLIGKMQFLSSGGDTTRGPQAMSPEMNAFAALNAAGPTEPPPVEETASEAESEGDSDSHVAADPAALYRQALELGLDRDDIIVKRILTQKMRLLIRLQATDDSPDDATLREFFESNINDYLQPSRVTFTHVFASRDRRGDAAQADMEKILGDLRNRRVESAGAARMGDPFPLGHTFRARSRNGIVKVFGDDMADSVLSTPETQWAGPFLSAYGWHAVWIEERMDEKPAPFEMVRSQVRLRYTNDRRDKHLENVLAELRDEYPIVIEGDPLPSGADGASS